MKTNRYRRQIIVKNFNQQDQKLLATRHAIIIGGGGLGSHSANLLTRIGIGNIDIIDNDVIDVTNLHRTSLFSEQDIGKLKTKILEKKLKTVNTEICIKGINQKVTSENIWSFTKYANIILDGTDSISLRLLINDVSIKNDIPWVYAGVYETIGMVMGILPKKTPCFRCITQDIPKSDNKELPVLGTLPATIAAIQCNEAIKILLGKHPAGLLIYDVWNQCFDKMNIKRNLSCPICGTKKKDK